MISNNILNRNDQSRIGNCTEANKLHHYLLHRNNLKWKTNINKHNSISTIKFAIRVFSLFSLNSFKMAVSRQRTNLEGKRITTEMVIN